MLMMKVILSETKATVLCWSVEEWRGC
ncbi:hypothetical protein EMIT0158MI4_220093 [Burkholderia ambifaria]